MDTTPDAPYQTGWWGFDLGQYRPCDGTYELYPYDSLPPLPEPDESLKWLGPLDAGGNAETAEQRAPSQTRDALEPLARHARSLGLTLPPSFTQLMSSPEMQRRIPSCTACEFELGNAFAPAPGADEGYLVTFLRDQQYCVLWYLYLTPSGNQRVLAFPGDMEEYLDEAEAGGEVTVEQIAAAFRVCAPTFASFIYRFWLENTLWFKLNSSHADPFTTAEQAYLNHYSQRRADQN